MVPVVDKEREGVVGKTIKRGEGKEA